MYTNADGLLNKRNELLAYIDEIHPEIIAVTEIKSKCQKEVNMVEYGIPTFDLFINENPERGVALWIHESLHAEEYKTFNNKNLKESIWCTFKYGLNEKVLIGCMYKSPNTSDDNVDKMIKLLKSDVIIR